MRAAFIRAVPWLLSSLGICAASCGSSDTVQVRIDVRTDWVPVAEFAEIEVSLDGAAETEIYDARFDDDFLTGVRVAVLDDVTPGTVVVRARILAADGRRLVQRRVAAEVRSPTTLTLVFTRSCLAVTCPDGADPAATECVGGRCVSPECSPENPEACGDGGCEADADCGDAPVGCARTICTDGECFVGSDFAACATSEYCHPEDGCTSRPVESDGGTPMSGDAGAPIDGGPPDACGQPCDTGNGCETGIYDCSGGEPTCVRDALVAAGTTCRESAGACDVEESCDGTAPTCPMDAFAATGTTCTAGFCDGLGTCSDTCTPGADCSTGDPCETGSISCDTGTPVCVRSGSAPNGTTCATTQNGTWSSCAGFSGSCDETGTRSRTVTAHACNGGVCQPSASDQTEACGRSTDGASCGSTTSTSWSTCSGYTSTCDETGSQSRTVTTRTCASGTCDANTSPEARSCSRDTDGGSCGSVTYGSWSSCGYSNTCDESATRSRSVMTPTCSAGSCSVVTTTETGSCTRNTDGTSCGSTTYGSWGTCRYDDGCDETGDQMRAVMVPECASGSCQTTTSSQTQACTRNTDGQTCLGVPFGCNTYRCGAGTCQSYYQCSFDEQCCEDTCTPFACP